MIELLGAAGIKWVASGGLAYVAGRILGKFPWWARVAAKITRPLLPEWLAGKPVKSARDRLDDLLAEDASLDGRARGDIRSALNRYDERRREAEGA